MSTVGNWTPEILDEIRRRSDITEIIGRYVNLRPQGRNLAGCCPFHDDRTPSFSVSPEKQVFYCFGCQVSGDVFEFVMKKEGMEFGEAVVALARETGVKLPERRLSPTEARRQRKRDDVLGALSEAAKFYRRLLEDWPGAEAARRYVEGRGVSEDMRQRFGLGYAPGGNRILRTLLSRGIGERALLDAGLVGEGSSGLYDRFRDRVIFPIHDEQGRVIAFGGRAMGDAGPKYLNSPETVVFNKRHVWFALDLARPAIRETNQALVMEGYMDVLTAHQFGFTNAVASLGTSLSQEQARALSRHAREVIIAYDADAAGATAALRGIELFRQAGCSIRVARVPEGKDPDGFLRSRGEDAFRRILAEAVPLVEFVFDQAAAGRDLSTVEGKSAVVEALLPHLAAEKSAVALDTHIRRLAPRLEVSEDALRQELRGRNRDTGRHLASKPEEYSNRNTWQNSRDYNPGQRPIVDISAGLSRGGVERHLLRLMIQRPELRVRGLEAVRPDEFEMEMHRRLAILLWESDPRAAGEDDGTALMSFGGEDAAVRRFVAALLMEEWEWEDPERAFVDCLKGMERRRWERRIAELNREIEKRSAEDKAIPRELGMELQELQRLASRERPVPRRAGP